MGLVKGVNCGFVLAAPSADPAEAEVFVCDYIIHSAKFTTPAVIESVTEIGWWCDNATDEANFECGIYTHDAVNNRPLDLIAGASIVNPKGTGAGWKRSTPINIVLSPNTIYWLSVQLDSVPGSCNMDNLADAGEKDDYKAPYLSLPAAWGSSTGTRAYLMSIYALYIETSANPYPTTLLKKGFISAYHCFMSAYIRAKVTGYDPLKLPDGTVF